MHLGFKSGIQRILRRSNSQELPSILEVDFSTDDATLDKASNILMWPVQIRVANILFSDPEVVGIYKGSSKPSNGSDVIGPFVDEVLETINNGGIDFFGTKFPIQLRCFIADAPARAFILNHAGHNSKAPCSKCWITGEYNGRMVFRGIHHKHRTDDEYLM